MSESAADAAATLDALPAKLLRQQEHKEKMELAQLELARTQAQADAERAKADAERAKADAQLAKVEAQRLKFLTAQLQLQLQHQQGGQSRPPAPAPPTDGPKPTTASSSLSNPAQTSCTAADAASPTASAPASYLRRPVSAPVVSRKAPPPLPVVAPKAAPAPAAAAAAPAKATTVFKLEKNWTNATAAASIFSKKEVSATPGDTPLWRKVAARFSKCTSLNKALRRPNTVRCECECMISALQDNRHGMPFETNDEALLWSRVHRFFDVPQYETGEKLLTGEPEMKRPDYIKSQKSRFWAQTEARRPPWEAGTPRNFDFGLF